MTDSREVLLGRLFVRLADSLVSDFDVIDVLDRLVSSCTDLLNATAAGLLLADSHDHLRVMAATSEATRLLELFELQNEQGPCLDCFRSGEAISAVAPEEQAERWPAFAGRMRELGLGAAYALPMRLRQRTIGSLNLYRVPGDPMSEEELQIAQALADVATITLLQHRATEANERLAVQLQTALNSRIAIEQAKGVLAQHAGIDMDQAFELLRAYARSRHRQLTEVATEVAVRRLLPDAIVDRTT